MMIILEGLQILSITIACILIFKTSKRLATSKEAEQITWACLSVVLITAYIIGYDCIGAGTLPTFGRLAGWGAWFFCTSRWHWLTDRARIREGRTTTVTITFNNTRLN